MGGGGEWSQQNQRSVPGKRGSPAQLTRGTHTTQPEAAVGWGPRGTQKRGHPGKGWEEESDLLALWPTVSVSINNLYPGCENVSVRSRSMMFEPGLTKGMLEVFGAPAHHPHCSADDQSTKAIDIQNAYLNGMACPLQMGRTSNFPLASVSPRKRWGQASVTAVQGQRKGQRSLRTEPGLEE